MGFKVSGVSGGLVVVTTLEDGAAEGVVVRDVDLVFVSKDTSFMLPVGEVGAEATGNRAIHRLEGLEYEGVICGARLDLV